MTIELTDNELELVSDAMMEFIKKKQSEKRDVADYLVMKEELKFVYEKIFPICPKFSFLRVADENKRMESMRENIVPDDERAILDERYSGIEFGPAYNAYVDKLKESGISYDDACKRAEKVCAKLNWWRYEE